MELLPRLKRIIEHYNLTSSTFADTIDVQRSSISHLLSGRNKPSLDFVMKIINKFPEVDLYWLLYGKGSFPKIEGIIEPKNQNDIIKEKKTAPSLFSENETSEQEPEIKSNMQFSAVENKQANTKKISRIILFFEDGSFEAYNQ
ncbi:transcriptional regulator [Tenacibaculum sp. Bg11-29]|uniref:helix-turn-helix domain-containing protein n=1 Tax=Tenacibaculum sp. Bg11-29 TaxID=2058306 RepID=UPI000C34F686|nr:helix-turn-helix transcriptional regulator [Tenacibaculum sp. Bg11-29]PKH51687.1 transcriptional regulator [Tenacibaculum sp. Bg11-29]